MAESRDRERLPQDSEDFWIWRGQMQSFVAQVEKTLTEVKADLRADMVRGNTDLTARLQENVLRLSREIELVRSDMLERGITLRTQMTTEITRLEQALTRATEETKRDQGDATKKLTVLWMALSIAVAVLMMVGPALVKMLFKLP